MTKPVGSLRADGFFQMFQEKTAFSVHEPVQVQADLRRIGAVDLARDLVDHEFPGQL